MQQQPNQVEVTGSRHFRDWMDECDVSLACTTYKAGRLLLFGRDKANRLTMSDWVSNRCMGMWTDGSSLCLATQVQIWRFANVLRSPANSQGESQGDRLYFPRSSWVTGDLDVHDLAPMADGRLVFVNTLFSCLATLCDENSFAPLWKPPFISRLAAEERCHLNGLAMQDGVPAYVTAVSKSDVADGWRDQRNAGGCVIDVRTNEIVADGLSMPHSPRIYRDELWVHDSGNGFFGRVDRKTGTFEPIAFCPGYLRGLSFIGKYAVVGLSDARHDVSFGDLALTKNLEDRHATPACGIFVIDLESGDIVHWLRLGGVVRELYDVALLPGVRCPQIVDFRTREIANSISIGPQQSLPDPIQHCGAAEVGAPDSIVASCQ